jgi:hypothetical protein
MPRHTRPRREPTDDYQQLSLWAKGPEHCAFELIRPVVLFGQSPAARARETGAPERTIRRKADRFDAYGMASLFAADDRDAVGELPNPLPVAGSIRPRACC